VGAYGAPPNPSLMVRGHLSQSPYVSSLSTPSMSRSQDMQNGGRGVIGPRDNVFPGPTVALDGPDHIGSNHPSPVSVENRLILQSIMASIQRNFCGGMLSRAPCSTTDMQ